MHIRRKVNLLLRRSPYQVVKTFHSAPSVGVPPEIVLDDDVLASMIAPHRKHAWIIAAPKTGSTWLSMLLKELLGWQTVGLSGGGVRREQEPDVRQILRFPRENIFSPHAHCRASESTVEFINRFRIKPIIQVRNIYDSVISFRDHCLNNGYLFPMAYIDEEFLGFGEEKQLQFVIDMVLPWYFNFYASWFQVAGLSPKNLLFVNYEELREDPRMTLVKILESLGECRSPFEIGRAIDRVSGMNTLKNKAVSGRGEVLLSDRHKAKIWELRRYYSHIDFSMVGL